MCLLLFFFLMDAWGGIPPTIEQLPTPKGVRVVRVRTIEPGHTAEFVNKAWTNDTGEDCSMFAYTDETLEIQCRTLDRQMWLVKDLPKGPTKIHIIRKDTFEIALWFPVT
jgi:hypothetical protein